MEFLIFIGAICFSIFATLCADNMQMLQINISHKRDRVILVAALIPPFVLSFMFGRNHTIGITQFLIVMVMVMLIIAAFSKNLKKALLFSFYGTAVLSGYSVLTVLFLDLTGLADVFPRKYWGIANMAVAIVPIAACHLLKRFLKTQLDMNIFNNRIMYILILISTVLLIFIYFSHVMADAFIQMGNWPANPADIGYVLFLVTIGFMFILIMRYVSRENALRKELFRAEVSKEYVRELEESYQALRKRQPRSGKAKPIQITVDEKIMVIEMNEIICIETTHVRHKLRLHTRDQIHEFNGELKSIEDELDERFVRCHRSYVINKEKIAFIDKKQNMVIMSNMLSCHVSKNGMKLLKEKC